jgi:hypothetical protein
MYRTHCDAEPMPHLLSCKAVAKLLPTEVFYLAVESVTRSFDRELCWKADAGHCVMKGYEKMLSHKKVTKVKQDI